MTWQERGTQHDPRVSIAWRECREYVKENKYISLYYEAIAAAIIGGMAYWQVPDRWIIVVGVVIIINSVSVFIAIGIGRLDRGRSYLEQCCHDIEKTVNSLWREKERRRPI
jgi:hypothetical protein